MATDPTKNCEYCSRNGLSFLATRIAYVPESSNSGSGRLPASITNSARMPKQQLTNGGYRLRVITEGFVYTYDEQRKYWRCFAATENGQFREYSTASAPRDEVTFACSREGHNVVSSLINVIEASKTGDIYVAYSRTWLTQKMRKQLVSDTAMRNKYMLKFNAASVVKGGAIPADTGRRVRNVGELGRLVPEYATDEATQLKVGIEHDGKTRRRNANNAPAQALPLIKRMHEHSPRNAIVLALPDAVGIVQDINHWRNIKAGELAQYQSDVKEMRPRMVAETVLKLKKGIEESGEDGAEQWKKRYEPKIRFSQLQRYYDKHQTKLKQLERKVTTAAADWCMWVESAPFKAAWALYDTSDSKDTDRTGLQLEWDFTQSVFGSGAVNTEHAIWKKWLTAQDFTDKTHPLWLALAGGRDDIVQHLQGQQDKMSSAAMAGNGLIENKSDLLNAINAFKAKLKKLGTQVSVTESAGQLAYTAAAQSQRMVAGNAKQAQVVGQRIRAFIAVRYTSTITRHASTVRLDVLALQVQETVWGPPKASATASVRTMQCSKFMQSVSGGYFGAYQADTRIAIDMWLPEEAGAMGKSGIHADAAAHRPSALSGSKSPLALPVPEDNFWKGMVQHLKGQNGKVSAGLLGLGVALSITNLNQKFAALDAAYQPGSTGDKATAWQSVVSGSMAMASVIGELTAGTLAKLADKKVIASSTRVGLLMSAGRATLVGGAAAVVASAIDGYQAWMQRVKMGEQGDEDAASAYRNLAFANGVMAIAFAGFAAIMAGKLFLAAGATTGIAGGLAAIASVSWVPFVGWVLLAIGVVAAIATILISKDAADKTDTPLEVWLTRCCWRVSNPRAEYSHAEEELNALHNAIYSMHVAFEWDDNFFTDDEIVVNIVMPGYTSTHSEYAWALTLPNKYSGRDPIIVGRHTSDYSADPVLKTPLRKEQSFSAWDGKSHAPAFTVSEAFTLITEKGIATLRGKVKIHAHYLNQATLRLEYWPDAINLPHLKLTPLGNGSNFQTVVD